ncbi:acetate--CoA ligase [Streptacidiphilus pinicola]|uniref:Acetate--CoA ligase n=1 Tax=Streptacidiphilus pinicola TaxID=2219663 RepID=A0A2X0IP45_9ACTN|nr:AMP-binding protein [Streptacidiphilus pinicola]RAG85303.1 acetate--CoA ligase [Streptacidiphilus pinicola]
MFPLKDLFRPVSAPLHLYDNFRTAADTFPNSKIHLDIPLRVFPELGTQTTYAAAAAAVGHLGEQAILLGIKPGDHVVIYKSALFDSYLLAVAVSYAGGVPVMISPHLDAETVTVMAARLKNPWLLFDDATAAKADAIASVDASRKAHTDTVRAHQVHAATGPARRPDVHDIVYMTHTSGTTGIPKLIAHSPTSMGWRVTWQRRVLSFLDTSGLVAFHISPVHSRFNIGIASLMSYGFPLLNIGDPGEDNVEQMMRRHRPLAIESHPNHLVRWASILDRDPSVFASVRYLHSTFDAVNKGTMLKYLRASKHRMPVYLQVYGQSECGPMVLRAHTRLSLRFSNARWMGVGMPKLTRARVVDESGNPVARGQQGAIEMFSRGRAVTYYGEQDRFEQNLRGPWWNSGDQGEIGHFGQLALHDRQVDLIDEVKSTLALEDALLDKLPFLNEVIMVRTPAGDPQPVISLTDRRTMDWDAWWACVAEMPRLERPVILPYDRFPRTATMKVQRNRLEHLLRDGISDAA